MHVYNMENSNGNVVPNQFIIEHYELTYFQSYNTVIARYNRESRILYLSRDWTYSKTTMKYFKLFIDEYTRFNYISKDAFEHLIKTDDDIVLLDWNDEL